MCVCHDVCVCVCEGVCESMCAFLCVGVNVCVLCVYDYLCVCIFVCACVYNIKKNMSECIICFLQLEEEEMAKKNVSLQSLSSSHLRRTLGGAKRIMRSFPINEGE